MEENKRGGVRPNSGRKKVGDKKVQFVVYVPKSWIPKEAGDVMRLRERVVDFIESDRNLVLSQNKPVEGNVRQTDDVPKKQQKNASAVKIQDLTNQSKTNYLIDTTAKVVDIRTDKNGVVKLDLDAQIEILTKAANSCSDTPLGRKAKANYLKQITELQSQIK